MKKDFSTSFKKNNFSVGTVVYVHPEYRYYTVEFPFENMKIKESFICRGDLFAAQEEGKIIK